MRTPKIPAGRAADIRAAAAGAADHTADDQRPRPTLSTTDPEPEGDPPRPGEPCAQRPATEAHAGEPHTSAHAPLLGGTAGRAETGRRAPRRRRAGGPRVGAALARHWLITVLLLAGLVLRVLTQIAYRPVLFYIDSTRYLYHAGGNDPVGYRVPLRLILVAGNLDAVAAVQHVLGLAMAVVIYVVLLRRGCVWWLAALAAAPLLLDAYQLQIEQTVMPDVWFEALLVAGLALLLWRPRPPWWIIGAAGVVLGLSATVAQVGEVLVLPAVAYLLAAGGGWRRALAGPACCAWPSCCRSSSTWASPPASPATSGCRTPAPAGSTGERRPRPTARRCGCPPPAGDVPDHGAEGGPGR